MSKKLKSFILLAVGFLIIIGLYYFLWWKFKRLNLLDLSQLIITVIAIITLYLTGRQMSLTREQAFKENMPEVDIFPKKEENGKSLLWVKNLSNFPAWVWIEIKAIERIEVGNKGKEEDRTDLLTSQYLKIKGGRAWQLPPNKAIWERFGQKLQDLLDKGKNIRLTICYYSSKTSGKESNPIFSELLYRYAEYGGEKSG